MLARLGAKLLPIPVPRICKKIIYRRIEIRCFSGKVPEVVRVLRQGDRVLEIV